MFCRNCGKEVGDAKFCPDCGAGQNGAVSSKPEQIPFNRAVAGNSPLDEEVILWEGRPASIGDKAKTFLNDDKYIITTQRIIFQTGIIGKKVTEINLKDIKDYSVKQNLGERVQNIGDITIVTEDPSSGGNVVLNNVKNAIAVKDILRKAVLDYKRHLGMFYRE
jgi:hypothetical protein